MSNDVVTITEAIITVGFMFALGFIAFAFDKLNSAKKEKLMHERLGNSKDGKVYI